MQIYTQILMVSVNSYHQSEIMMSKVLYLNKIKHISVFKLQVKGKRNS